jgi:hypothetical protein
MKDYIRNILKKFSRIIYWILPLEFFPKKPDLERDLWEDCTRDCYKHFKEYFKQSLLINNSKGIRGYAIKKSVAKDKEQNYYYLEFGVWKGESSNFFSKYVKKLYAFDSFEGLKEDWAGTDYQASYFNLSKKPKFNSNIEPVVGYVQDTLDNFTTKYSPKINFMHMDMDTYESTRFVLDKLKSSLVPGAIIIFDELYNFPGWEYGEYKALKEVFQDNEYVFLAFNLKGGQAVIQIL